MWRKWWTPNNASKWQKGFNSAFKGLILILLTVHLWTRNTNMNNVPDRMLQSYCTTVFHTHTPPLKPKKKRMEILSTICGA
jgi:hypothetical protein